MGNTFVKAVVGANLLLVFALLAAGFWALGAGWPRVGAGAAYFSLLDCAEVILQTGPSLAGAALCCWAAKRLGGGLALQGVGLVCVFGLLGGIYRETIALSGLEQLLCGVAIFVLWMSIEARFADGEASGVPRLPAPPPAAGGRRVVGPALRAAGGAAGKRLHALARLVSAHVGKHWRGEFGLPTSALANGAAVGLCFWWVAFPVLNETLPAFVGWHWASDAWDRLLVGNAAWAAAALVVVWQAVGLWRSARRHSGRAWRGWTLGARLAAAASVAVFAHGLVGEAPRLHYEFRLARLLGTVSSPRVVRVSNDGEELFYAGDLRFGAARALGRVLARDGASVRVLHLLSYGGFAGEAMRMAEMVRARGLETRVVSVCSSACTFVFRAGRVRALGEKARLGFHRTARVTDTAYGRERFRGALAFLRSVHESAGDPDWFIARVEATPFETLWQPTKQELLDAGFVTAVVPGGDAWPRWSSTGRLSLELPWQRQDPPGTARDPHGRAADARPD